jgi:ClpP class serine protease
MTPEIREMYESILQDIEERFISVLAQERSLDEEDIRRILAVGLSSADQALEEQLVDALGYKHEIQERLAGSGEDAGGNGSLSARAYLEAVESDYRSRSCAASVRMRASRELSSGWIVRGAQWWDPTWCGRRWHSLKKPKNLWWFPCPALPDRGAITSPWRLIT